MQEKSHPKFFYKFIRKLLIIFSTKPKIINLNQSLANQAIYISNHSAANGPLKLNLFLPFSFVFWGTHEMLENYKNRRKYLIDVFYRQKLHYGKVKSFIIGTLFAIISKYIYTNARVIATSKDLGFISTLKKSFSVLNNNENILIFPEDSHNGYHDILQKYFPGFAMLANYYYKKTNIDLPVYPIYFFKKGKTIIIGKPISVNNLIFEGKNFAEIAEIALNSTNELARQVINI